jgi:hypothetical protein
MLRLNSFFKVKFSSVVLGCLLYRNRLHVAPKEKKKNKLNSCPSRESLSSLDIISVCGSIPIEIPILWPRAVMVGPRPRVLLMPPLVVTIKCTGTFWSPCTSEAIISVASCQCQCGSVHHVHYTCTCV